MIRHLFFRKTLSLTVVKPTRVSSSATLFLLTMNSATYAPGSAVLPREGGVGMNLNQWLQEHGLGMLEEYLVSEGFDSLEILLGARDTDLWDLLDAKQEPKLKTAVCCDTFAYGTKTCPGTD